MEMGGRKWGGKPDRSRGYGPASVRVPSDYMQNKPLALFA